MCASPRESSVARTFSPVPTGTVLFITRIARSSGAGSSSTTTQTDEGSAWPEYVGGVPTQTNIRFAAARSAESSVNISRSRLRSTSSARPGSWNGTRPALSASIRGSTMSRMITGWPSSARQATVTRAAQPAPKMPIAGFSLLTRRSLAGHRPEATRDCQHRLVRERVQQRVHDPVAGALGAQHDHVQVAAGVVEVEASLADPLREALVQQRGRAKPVALLDPPVLVRPCLVGEADGGPAAEHVGARGRIAAAGVEVGAALEHRRELEPERHALLVLHECGLGLPRVPPDVRRVMGRRGRDDEWREVAV